MIRAMFLRVAALSGDIAGRCVIWRAGAVRIFRALAHPAAMAAATATLVTGSACYVALALVVRHQANLWDPFKWQIKAAGIVLAVTAVVYGVLAANDRRKAVR